jgi:hypothetical protein
LIGSLIGSLVKIFDFSKVTLYRVNKMVEKHVHKIAPAYFSKICATTGLLIFLIKDALEHAGIIFVDKKTPAGRVYDNLIFAAEYEKEKVNRISKIIEKYYK